MKRTSQDQNSDMDEVSALWERASQRKEFVKSFEY